MLIHRHNGRNACMSFPPTRCDKAAETLCVAATTRRQLTFDHQRGKHDAPEAGFCSVYVHERMRSGGVSISISSADKVLRSPVRGQDANAARYSIHSVFHDVTPVLSERGGTAGGKINGGSSHCFLIFFFFFSLKSSFQ